MSTKRLSRRSFFRPLRAEQLESRTVMDASGWHNDLLLGDVNVDGVVDATDAATIESFLTLYQSTEVAVTPGTCMSNRIFPDANGDWLVNDDDIDFVGGLYGNTSQVGDGGTEGHGYQSEGEGSGSGSSSGSGGGSSSGSGGGMPTGSGMWGIAEPGFFVSGNEPLSEHVDHEQFVDFWVQFSDHNAEGGTVHWATEEISMESDASNGPAEEGEDFEIASGTITIPAGVSTYSTLVRVKVKFDELDEPTEWFRVRLSNPSSGTRIIQSEESQIGKIADRDCGCNRQQGSPPVAFPTVPASTVSDDEYTFAPDENGTQQPVTPVSAVDFDYVFEPTREHMQPEGFQFAWKMKFDANAVGLIGHQVVKTKIVGYDKDGNVVHTIESYVVDGLGIKASREFSDIQNTRVFERTISDWVRLDGVCKIRFSRSGDFRLTDSVDLRFSDGSVVAYDPSVHGEGMLLHIEKIDGLTTEHRSLLSVGGNPHTESGPGPAYNTPIYIEAVRFNGPAKYRAVWHDEVDTRVTRNPYTGTYFNYKGKLTWDQGIGGAAGAQGLSVFPEKPQFDPNVPNGIDRDYTDYESYRLTYIDDFPSPEVP